MRWLSVATCWGTAAGRDLERWTAPLTIAYFVFYALDYFLLSRAFLAATVHLVLSPCGAHIFPAARSHYTTLGSWHF